jgi:hypothetical protein
MRINGFAKHACHAVVLAAGLAVAVSFVPCSAEAGIDTGAAVGIGLGSFALGGALGAAPNPYYRPYPYGYYYPAAPVYYSPPPVYYAPPAYYPPLRSCWDPYYAGYYAC